MNEATIKFIRENADADVRQLALRGTKNPEVDIAYALEQIAGRQKARTKIPCWAAVEGIVYPPHLAMEQCSSEQTARYKAAVAGRGSLVVDLTAGFGVDMAFLSQGFEHAVHVERQPQLCAISSENYRCLGLDNIEVVCGDGIDYLHRLTHVDLLYIDPARRDEHGGRTYGIADCTPNVLEYLDEMLEKSDRVMLKLSPMLDWRKAVEDLERLRVGERNSGMKVDEVHIVSVDNECKELLLILSKDEKPLKLVCVNNDDIFTVGSESTADAHPQILSQTFLYEPNASIMKAGCFDEIERCFPAIQLDTNSHLFVSDREISDFPGRRFVIERTTSMNRKELKQSLDGIDRANITVRNFPLTVAELRKKLRLKEGGDVFIFATTVAKEGHKLFICRKIG